MLRGKECRNVSRTGKDRQCRHDAGLSPHHEQTTHSLSAQQLYLRPPHTPSNMVHLFLAVISCVLLSSLVQAINLYVSSYNGNLTTLSLTRHAAARPSWRQRYPPELYHHHSSASPDFTYTLTATQTLNTTTDSPSWLLLDRQNSLLYLVSEAVTPNSPGALVIYRTAVNGALTQIHKLITPPGGVHAAFFAHGSALAIPHYSTSQLLTYTLSPSNPPAPLQTINYTLPSPGPIPNRQDAPHPHETLLDPSGAYLLVPDLGADLVRIHAINATTAQLSQTSPLVAASGSGPRHAVFTRDVLTDGYVFYLAAEISATVTAYDVDYSGGSLTFRELPRGVYPSLGAGHVVPPTTTGESTGVTAEIAITPDGRYVVASNRRDGSFDTSDGVSDSMATWRIDPYAYDGELNFLGLFPAGGEWPRQFAVNAAGDLVAVALQLSGRVVVLERDVGSGEFVRQVAAVEGLGPVTCVVWDE